jgi:hypothetical protein
MCGYVTDSILLHVVVHTDAQLFVSSLLKFSVPYVHESVCQEFCRYSHHLNNSAGRMIYTLRQLHLKTVLSSYKQFVVEILQE